VDEVVAYRRIQGTNSSVYYPQYNHLYSVAAVTDGSGQVVERFTYDAYGKQTAAVMAGQTASGFGRGFTGYITDDETGLLHARARQYSPTLGRFVGRDPLGYVDGYSTYGAYFAPNSVDPTGESRECDEAYRNDNSRCARLQGIARAACYTQARDRKRRCEEREPYQDCFNASPTSDTSGCEKWRGHRFMGADAMCVCECAGDSPWDNYVRACLSCMHSKGQYGGTAHDLCYEEADRRYGRASGWAQRLDIATRCCYCWATRN
jgi:RHS repeat-associated protein